MKFIHYLEKVTGVDIYGLIPLTIFFTLFVLVVLYAWKADKTMINEISQLPLDN
jgi:hypothetical protein